jgi:genome maintenance exonuclease 1
MARTIIENAFRHIDESWGVEVSLYYPELYAGTTDHAGVWKGKPAIMDFKQSNKLKKKEWISDYFLQLCSYSEAHNELFNTEIKTGVILLCTQDFQYQEFVIEEDEFEFWKNKWYDRVAQYYGV